MPLRRFKAPEGAYTLEGSSEGERKPLYPPASIGPLRSTRMTLCALGESLGTFIVWNFNEAIYVCRTDLIGKVRAADGKLVDGFLWPNRLTLTWLSIIDSSYFMPTMHSPFRSPQEPLSSPAALHVTLSRRPKTTGPTFWLAWLMDQVPEKYKERQPRDDDAHFCTGWGARMALTCLLRHV